MNFIFLVILMSCTQIKSEDDQKYIDLLPESEKQAFLDIVARRLFKEVESKVTNAKSGEIPDKQLEEHGDFVRRILAEESSNLRRNKDDDDKEIGVTRTIKEGDIKSEEEASGHIDLTLRNGKRLKRSNSLEKTNENQSHKDDEIPVQVIYDNNDVSTMKTLSGEASDATDIQVKGLRRSSDNVKGDLRSHTVITNYDPDDTAESENSKDDSNSKEAPKGSHSNGITASIYEEQQSGEVFSDIDVNQTTNTPLLTSSVTITTVPTKIDTTTTQATTTTTTTTIKLETQKIQNKTENNTETIQPRYLRSAGKIAEINDTEISYNVTNSPEAKENNTYNSSENTTTITTVTEIPLTTTVLPLITDKPIGRSKIEVETHDRNKLATATKNTDKTKTTTEVVIDSITTAKLPITIDPGLGKMASTVYKALDNLITANKSGVNENATNEVKIFKNLVKALRNGLQFQFEEYEEDDNENQKPKQSLLDWKPLTTEKPYEVYEIAADIEPFIKKPKNITYKEKRKSITKKHSKNDISKHKQKLLNEEQPYYVPVYNYSPEQVYFNSYNRLGPNYDQTDDIDDNINDLDEKTNDKAIKRQGKTDGTIRKFRFNQKAERTEKKNRYSSRILKNNKAKLKMPLVIKSPKFTEIYFNPDDYLDMDYYFGRRREPKIPLKTGRFAKPKDRYFPKTDDEEHVINAMKSGRAKSHRNAIKQLLYARTILGHIADTEPTQSDEFILRSRNSTKDSEEIQKFYRNLAPEEKDEISIDYYFGFEDKYKNLNGRLKKRANSDCDMCKKSIFKYNNKRKKSVSLREAVTVVDEDENEEEPENQKTGSIKEILSLYPPDAFIHIDELLKYKVPLARTTARDNEVKPFLTVVKDMIDSGNDALVQYDWLGTTVDIQSALDKLTDLSEVLLDGDNVHQSDLQLFKYFQYLYVTSKATLDESKPLRINMEKEEDRKNLLPKNKNRKPAYLKNKGLLHRAWLIFRGRYDQVHSKKTLTELQMFLVKLNEGLYDLHTALKSIASITTYKNQRCFQNLKDLYLKDAKDKQLLEVLLHLSSSRLFGLLEESAKDQLEESYPLFIEKHEKEVLRTKEEFVFLLKVLEELGKLDE